MKEKSMIKIKRSIASVFGWLIPAAVLSSIQRRPRPEGNANGIGILSLKLAGWLRRGPGPWSSGRCGPTTSVLNYGGLTGRPFYLGQAHMTDLFLSFFLFFFLSFFLSVYRGCSQQNLY